MMYYNFMETLRKNEYPLTRDVVCEIRHAPITAHYRTLPDKEIYNRVHKVLYHMYKRHADCLNNSSTKNTLGAWYSRLGQERFHEGFPQEEVVEALFFLKRRIMRCVADRMHLEEDWSVTQAAKLYWNVSLFFDAMARSVMEGYRKESSRRPDQASEMG